jgi:MSHA pilin protein MshA
MKLKDLKKSEAGFTLIEIIAVLVLLGILAAVAVPRFFDLQDEARDQAMEGALAEGMSTMSMAYAQRLLQDGSATTSQVASVATANAPASDDFSYTFASSGLVTVAAKSGGAVAGATDVSKQWSKP